jgi:hypothetical protein
VTSLPTYWTACPQLLSKASSTSEESRVTSKRGADAIRSYLRLLRRALACTLLHIQHDICTAGFHHWTPSARREPMPIGTFLAGRPRAPRMPGACLRCKARLRWMFHSQAASYLFGGFDVNENGAMSRQYQGCVPLPQRCIHCWR